MFWKRLIYSLVICLVHQYNAYNGFHVASHLFQVPEMNSPCNFWPEMILPTSIFRRWQDFISHSHRFYYCASLDSRDDAVKKSAETTNIPTSSAPVGFCTSAIRLLSLLTFVDFGCCCLERFGLSFVCFAGPGAQFCAPLHKYHTLKVP